jgi:THO complex subunit 4
MSGCLADFFCSHKHQGTGPIRTKAARVTKSGPKRPKTAEELDQELDSFMKDEPKVAVGKVGSNVPTQAPVKTAADTDVEMS